MGRTDGLHRSCWVVPKGGVVDAEQAKDKDRVDRGCPDGRKISHNPGKSDLLRQGIARSVGREKIHGIAEVRTHGMKCTPIRHLRATCQMSSTGSEGHHVGNKSSESAHGLSTSGGSPYTTASCSFDASFLRERCRRNDVRSLGSARECIRRSR